MLALQPPLRGRDREIATLTSQIRGLAAGQGGLVLLKGPAGAGKSLLLAKAETIARQCGLRVFHGAADISAQLAPLGALLDALVVRDDPPVSPDLMRQLTRTPDRRFWALRELQEGLERAALANPLAIMLDDLQWADAATLGALSTLPRRLAAHRIMWLLAMRPYEHARPADAAIRRIESSAMVSVTLGGLDDGAVAAVAHDIIGACPDRGLLDQLAGVRGNPFLVAELLRGLREEDLITIEGGQARLAGRQIPRRFRDSVSWQLGRLSPRARDVLQMAAVLSRRFAVDELATLLEQPPQALIAPLHEVLAAGLLVEDGDRLAFRHDLVREAVDASLPAAMRIAMRRRAIETVLHHGAPPADVAELAMEVAQPGDRTAIGLLRQAAAQIGRVSPSVACVLSQRALELIPPGDPARGDTAVETIDMLVQAGHAADADRLVAITADELRHHPGAAEARLGVAILSMQYNPSAVVDHCQRALELPDVPAHIRDQLLSYLACGYELLGDIRRAAAPTRQAVAEAAGSAEPGSAAASLIPRAALALARGSWQQSLDLASEATARKYQADGGTVRLWLPEAWKALILISVARLDEAFALIDAGVGAAQQAGILANVRVWSMLRCRALLSCGQLADARAEAEAILEMSDEIGADRQGYLNDIASYALGCTALHTGDWQQARSVAARLSLASFRSSQRLGAWLLARLADATAPAGQRGPLDADILDPLADGYLPEAGQPPGTPVILRASSPRQHADAAALTRMLRRTGQLEAAREVTERIERAAAAHPDFPFLRAASVHARAVLEDSADLALAALELHRADQRRLVRASVLEDCGRLLPAARRDEAVRHLTAALDLCTAAGADRDASRLRLRLRRIGVVSARAAAAPCAQWPELTESEISVVRLVSQGATDREVAEQLFLSGHTVNSHLRHVFAKLGIRSRVELARIAGERAASLA
jgi:DNA-binding CsgD family transcriptional regulator